MVRVAEELRKAVSSAFRGDFRPMHNAGKRKLFHCTNHIPSWAGLPCQ